MASPGVPNPFEIPRIINQIKANLNGNIITQDLARLRTVSTSFQQTMSSAYFDTLNKAILVNEFGDIGMVVGQNQHGYMSHRNSLIKTINHQTWTPDLAPVFRRIKIHYYQLINWNELKLSINDIAPFLGPYIKELEFYPRWNDLGSDSWMKGKSMIWGIILGNLGGYDYEECTKTDYLDFFTNLKNFLSHFEKLEIVKFDARQSLPDAEDFVSVIGCLNASVKIIFVLSLTCPYFEVEVFKTFVSSFKMISPNVKFQIDYGEISTYQEFNSAADIILENSDVILEPSIRLIVSDVVRANPNNPLIGNIKLKLLNLSQYLHTMIIEDEPDEPINYQQLFHSVIFHKVKVLEVPFNAETCELRRNCPLLQKLVLCLGDQETCIFNNQQQTDQENVREFIDSLDIQNLKKFRLYLGRSPRTKIDNKEDNELFLYMKSLIPESVNFKLC